MRKVLQDPATRRVWEDKGMMVPEDVKPQAYQAEIAERIQFYQPSPKPTTSFSNDPIPRPTPRPYAHRPVAAL